MNMYLKHALILLINVSYSIIYGFDLTIIHTNDVHARFEEIDRFAGSCDSKESAAGECFGGAARRYTKVQEIKANDSNVIFLDGGDQFQGTLWYYYYQGDATAYFANKLGYDVGALGNHEFDDGPNVLGRYLRNLTFPILACNVDATNEPALNGYYKSSVVLEVAGEKIGVTGYLTSETRILVPPKFVANVIFNDEITCLKSEVQKLQSQGINKIVAIGHSGFKRDLEIAKEVDGIDVIVGGHSNTFLYTGTPPSTEEPADPYPTVVTNKNGNKVYVVQAYAFGKYLGYLKLKFDQQGVVTSAVGNPILLDNSVKQDPNILNDLEQWKEPLKKIFNETVGHTYVKLDGHRTMCRLKECNLGNLVTDAVLYQHLLKPGVVGAWSESSVSFWNSGGIRASMEQGQINFGELSEILPFRNEIVGFKLQGRYIRDVLEQSVKNYDPKEPVGAFVQVSGLKVVYDLRKNPGDRVKSVLIRCSKCSVPKFEPLDDSKMYGLVSSSFLMGGGDGYEVLVKHAKEKLEYGIISVDSVREYIEQHSPIVLGEEGRISFYTGNDLPTSSASRLYSYYQFISLFCSLVMFVILN